MHNSRYSGVLGGMFVLIFWAIMGTAAAAETTYTIDAQRSEFTVQLFKAGAGAVLAHDHVVRAQRYTGHIRFDPATPNTSAVTIEVQTASLVIDEPPLRQKYGLSSQLSDTDRHSIQETMESASQLDVTRYPVMTFASTKIDMHDGKTATVTGQLTVRGITQTVTFPAQLEQRTQTLQVRGSFRFKQSSFGYEPYRAFLGAVRNQDEVLLLFDVIAVPEKK